MSDRNMIAIEPVEWTIAATLHDSVRGNGPMFDELSPATKKRKVAAVKAAAHLFMRYAYEHADYEAAGRKLASLLDGEQQTRQDCQSCSNSILEQ